LLFEHHFGKEGKSRQGKPSEGEEIQKLLKQLIYLAKNHIPLANKEWW